MFVVLVLLGVPPLALSIVANSYEFNDKGLGIIFPLLSVACAVGAALPDAIGKFETKREKEREIARQAREQKRKDKKRERELLQRLENMGNAIGTLQQYASNPQATRENVAQELGITRQAVGQHLKK